MKRVFTAWGEPGQHIASTLVMGEGPPRFANGEVFPDVGVMLWRIEVGSLEEARAIFHLRNGFNAYTTMGSAAPCPSCGALHYPEDSGQCWRCEHKC